MTKSNALKLTEYQLTIIEDVCLGVVYRALGDQSKTEFTAGMPEVTREALSVTIAQTLDKWLREYKPPTPPFANVDRGRFGKIGYVDDKPRA